MHVHSFTFTVGKCPARSLTRLESKRLECFKRFILNEKRRSFKVIALNLSITIIFQSCRFFQVVIITFRADYTDVVKPPASFTPQDLMTYAEAHNFPVPAAYVTFQFRGDNFDKYQEFIIGNGAQSNSNTRDERSSDVESFYNKPLQPNTNYRVFLRVFVTEVSQGISHL